MRTYNETKTYYAIQKGISGFFQYDEDCEEDYDEEGNLTTFIQLPLFVGVRSCYQFKTKELAEDFLYNNAYVTKCFPETFKNCRVTKVTIETTITLE